MAIPAKMILFVEIKLVYLELMPFAMKNIIAVERTANRNETGVISQNGKATGSINIRIAPSPAPEDIPSKPGSARLFLRSDCRIKPELASEAPTINAFSVLGNLMSKTIFLETSLPENKDENTSLKGIETLPIESDTIKDMIKTMNKKNNIICFFDKINNYKLRQVKLVSYKNE
jgi:hypothetical protein